MSVTTCLLGFGVWGVDCVDGLLLGCVDISISGPDLVGVVHPRVAPLQRRHRDDAAGLLQDAQRQADARALQLRLHAAHGLVEGAPEVDL
jgi:hypothetical protein